MLASLWGGYSHLTAAIDLPANASRLEKVMADPPAYLPWIIAALFLVVLAWSLWPSRDEGTESKSDAHHNGDKTGFIVSIGGKNNRFEDNSGPADRPIVTLINEEGSVAKGNRPHGPQPK